MIQNISISNFLFSRQKVELHCKRSAGQVCSGASASASSLAGLKLRHRKCWTDPVHRWFFFILLLHLLPPGSRDWKCQSVSPGWKLARRGCAGPSSPSPAGSLRLYPPALSRQTQQSGAATFSRDIDQLLSWGGADAAKNPRESEKEEADTYWESIFPVSIPWLVLRFIETIFLFEKRFVGEDEGEIRGEDKRPVDIAFNDGAPTRTVDNRNWRFCPALKSHLDSDSISDIN